MRLLQRGDNGDFSLTEFHGASIPKYAILSHTWGEDHEEVSLRDVTNGAYKNKPGFRKLSFCADQAARDNLHYFWIDTCCIDKTSSAELAEAINSFFRWYQDAATCYVFLFDVLANDPNRADQSHQAWEQDFRKSKWFTRGWTLQELIAPESVEFFSSDGEKLGDKGSLQQTLYEVTGIAIQALLGCPMSYFSVDVRMSWAANRVTKRPEDAAYCLLGIFGVHMSPIYGEGREGAFFRLRREIDDRNSISLPTAKGASFNSHREEHNSTCLQGTRTILLEQIEEWAQKKDSKPIFWLSGMAGTGKSTIARTISQSLFSQGQLGASFFFKQGEGDADSAILERALKDQFEQLILQPLLQMQQTQSSSSPLIIVIDALDECEKEEDIQAILQLFARVKEVEQVSLRILATSRPELFLRLGFKRMPDGTHQDVILEHVTRSTIEHDIRLFIEHELRKIQQHRFLSSDWPREDQVRDLVDLSQPLFIFAATVCRYISSKGGNPEEYLEKVLQYRKSTFSQLDRTYLPILDQLLTEQEEDDKSSWLCAFQELVGSIVVLESPLSSKSLSRLLHISQQQIRCRLDSLHSVLSIPDNEDEPIRPLHLSFREFLIDHKKQGMPFWIDKRIAHEKLASCCLKLMSHSNGLRQDICNLVRPGVLKSEIDENVVKRALPSELQYACRYWVEHLEQGLPDIKDEGIVHKFLKTRFLYWLEAMSLLGEASRCIYHINKLQALANLDAAGVRLFLRDAARFTQRFQKILVDAPLQVYSSALFFTPENSITRKTFANLTAKWIELLSTETETDWSAYRSTLEGHTGHIEAVNFSPNGRLIASCSRDRKVRIWESETGLCRSTLNGHTNAVTDAIFSPDGILVASASEDKTIRLWDTKTWTHWKTLTGHLDWVLCVAFSPDGQLVASGSCDSTVRLWDMANGFFCMTLEGHTDSVISVAISPNSQLIASTSLDGTIRLWDRVTGSHRSTFHGYSSSIHAISFSPNSQLLVSTSSSGYHHPGSDNERPLVPEPTEATDVGKIQYDDNEILLLDVVTESISYKIVNMCDTASSRAFSPNGKLIGATHIKDGIRVFDIDAKLWLGTFEGSAGYPEAVAFSPDGQLIASGSMSGIVQLWDIPSEPCGNTTQTQLRQMFEVASSPDGQLFVSNSFNTLYVWEASTGTCIKLLKGVTTGAFSIIFSPDSRILLVSEFYRPNIYMWDTETWSKITFNTDTTQGHGAHRGRRSEVRPVKGKDVIFSMDGQLLAYIHPSGAIELWDIWTNSLYSTPSDSSGTINALSISLDNQLVAFGNNQVLKIWNVATRLYLKLEGHVDVITDVAFSQKPQLLASASEDKMIRLWDVLSGRCIHTLEGHALAVSNVAFSRDSLLLASSSIDRTIRLWDVVSGTCYKIIDDHPCMIGRLAFSLDGTCLETDRGSLPISTHTRGSSFSQKDRLPAVFVNDQWICVEGERMLWVPPEYRLRPIAVAGDTVFLEGSSGGHTILRLRIDCMKWI